MDGRRVVLFIFILIMLIGIPISVYFIQQQQQVQTHAQKTTVLSFEPTSNTTNPIRKNVADTVSLDVVIDPGQNLVSIVKLVIGYDATKLQPIETEPFLPNTSAFPTTIEGPVQQDGKFAVTLSIGSDPTRAIRAPTKVGKITFKALSGTASTPTTVSFTSETQVSSTGAGDESGEDVLQTRNPAKIAIAASSNTPPPAIQPSPTSGNPLIKPSPTPTRIVRRISPTIARVSPTRVPTPTQIAALPTSIPTPSLPAPGPGDTVIRYGILAGGIALIGVVLFFAF